MPLTERPTEAILIDFWLGVPFLIPSDELKINFTGGFLEISYWSFPRQSENLLSDAFKKVKMVQPLQKLFIL